MPKDAEPGGAVVATDAGDGDPFGPLEVPFEVLGGGPGRPVALRHGLVRLRERYRLR